MKILVVVQDFPCVSETFVLNQVTGMIDLGHDVQVYPLGRRNMKTVHEDFRDYNLLERVWTPTKVPKSKLKRILGAASLVPKFITNFGLNTLGLLNIMRHGRLASSLVLFYSAIPFLNKQWKPDIILCHFGNNGVVADLWVKYGITICVNRD